MVLYPTLLLLLHILLHFLWRYTNIPPSRLYFEAWRIAEKLFSWHSNKSTELWDLCSIQGKKPFHCAIEHFLVLVLVLKENKSLFETKSLLKQNTYPIPTPKRPPTGPNFPQGKYPVYPESLFLVIFPNTLSSVQERSLLPFAPSPSSFSLKLPSGINQSLLVVPNAHHDPFVLFW